MIRATKPLSYFGTIIDDFQFRFEDGAVVSATAGTGQDALDRILDMDEGSVRLGEVALVPQSSLVAAQDLVWRHVLFDENDASHFALGAAYPVCFDEGAAMSREEQTSVGLNHSLFRLGSAGHVFFFDLRDSQPAKVVSAKAAPSDQSHKHHQGPGVWQLLHQSLQTNL